MLIRLLTDAKLGSEDHNVVGRIQLVGADKLQPDGFVPQRRQAGNALGQDPIVVDDLQDEHCPRIEQTVAIHQYPLDLFLTFQVYQGVSDAESQIKTRIQLFNHGQHVHDLEDRVQIRPLSLGPGGFDHVPIQVDSRQSMPLLS